MKKNILYISYDGLMEPLGESQVLKYLIKISSTHNIHLISFEKGDDLKNTQKYQDFKDVCCENQIVWRPLRYSKFIRYISSLKNIFNLFIQVWIILIAKKIEIVHIRSYIPGIAALPLKKLFKFSLVFDMRGLWADEKVDRLGWKKNQLKYKFFKSLEAKLLDHSQSIISLTTGLKKYLIEHGYDGGKITTIRTCVDLEIFYPINCENEESFINLGYLGSTDTAYDIVPVLKLFNKILSIRQNIKLKIFTKSDSRVIYKLANDLGINSQFIEIRFCDREDLNLAINDLNAILFYLKPSFSLLASMPTKIGESLACNVPIICNPFNEDIKELVGNNDAGQLIEFDNMNKEASKVIDFIDSYANKSICRDLANQAFNLDLGAQKISDIYFRI